MNRAVFLLAGASALAACSTSVSKVSLGESGQATTSATVALSCPSPFVAGTSAVNLTATVKAGSTAESGTVTWSSTTPGVTLVGTAEGETSALSGGTASAAFSATNTGTATVKAAWSNLTQTCSISVVANPTSDLLTCPKTFVAGDSPTAVSLNLKEGSAELAGEPVTWTTTLGTISPSAADPTGSGGVSSATFASTTAGPATVKATWGVGPKSASCPITVQPNTVLPASTQMTCASPIVAGTSPVSGTSIKLVDAYGNGVSEKVSWASNSTNLKLSSASTTTSSSGAAAIKIDSKVTGSYTITASYPYGSTTESPSCPVTVTHAALNKAKSSLTVSGSPATVPGPVTVSAAANDEYGNVDTSATITLTVSGPAAFGNGATSFSNSGGTAGTTLSTTLAGAQTVTATITDGATTVVLTKAVTFKAGAADTSPAGSSGNNFGSSFTTFLTRNDTSASGQDPIEPEVCLADAYGNPVVGVTITFGATGTAGGNKFTPATAKTGTNGCATTSWTSTVVYSNGENLTWSVPDGSPVTVTNPTAYFIEPSQAFAAPPTVNTGNGTLVFTNGLTSSSVASDGSVTVTFTVKNSEKPVAPVSGVACSFYAVAAQSRFAADDNGWQWGNGQPYFQDGYTDSVKNYSLHGDAYASSTGQQTNSSGQCTTTLFPSGPGWSITVYAEAASVPLTTKSTQNVVVSKVLTVVDGAVSYVGLGADSSYMPADGKTTVQLKAQVTDTDNHPLSGETVTLTAAPGTDCYGISGSGEAEAGALTFAPSSGPTATVGVGSDNTAVQYNGADGFFVTTVKATKPGCYDITATSNGVPSSSVPLAFVNPIHAAALSVAPNPLGYDSGNTTTVTVVVTDASGAGIPGQAVEFPTNELWNADNFSSSSSGSNPSTDCDVTTGEFSGSPSNTCVITDETGTASLKLGYPNDGQAALATNSVDFLVAVHEGTLGYPETGLSQKDVATGVPLPMTPVKEELPAAILLVDATQSTFGLARGSPGSVFADGTSTVTLVATALNSSGQPQAGATVSITSGSSSDVITPSSGVTLSDGTFTFTVASTAIQASDTVVALIDGMYELSTSVQFTSDAPANLSYSPGSQTYKNGVAITALAPTFQNGPLTACSSLPSLPTGLSLDQASCTLSGTPSGVWPQATYTITATNGGGSTTAPLTITVNDQPPTGLTYAASPATFYQFVALSPADAPSLAGGGPVTLWGISATLPAGLSLDTTTGIVSGTPTVLSAATDYTVTAWNSGGSTTVDLNITVTCASGWTLSGSTCYNLPTDANNCGTIGNQCAAAAVCSSGSCTGSVLDLRADEGVTINDSGQVTAWADQSGNDNNASATSGGPVVAIGADDDPVLQFNGSDSPLVAPPMQPSAGTMFIVVAGSSGVSAGWGDSLGNNGIGFLYLGSTELDFLERGGGISDCTVDPASTLSVNAINWGPSGTSYTAYSSNGEPLSSCGSGAGGAIGNSGLSLHIGSGGGGSNPFTGDVTEIVLFDSQLPPATITAEANTLLQRWFTTTPSFVVTPTVADSSTGTTVNADGVSTFTVTVTERDSNGLPLAGQTVSISGFGTNDVASSGTLSDGTLTGTTDASGRFTATVSSAVPEVDSLSAAYCGTNWSATLAFTPPDTVNSTFTTSAANVLDDDTSTATLTLTLVDSNNVPLSGQSVTLSGFAGTDVLSGPTTGVTNGSGQFWVSVASAVVETDNISASVVVQSGSSSVTVRFGPVSVTFGLPTCESGQTYCSGTTCTNLQSDPNNCGACGTQCSSGQFCLVGTCAVAGILDLRADMDVFTDGNGGVTRWQDQSGSGNDAIASSNGPTVGTGTNGLPILQFSGGNAPLVSPPQTPPVGTMFLVVSGSSGRLFGWENAGDGSNGLALAFYGGSAVQAIFRDGGDSGDCSMAANTTVLGVEALSWGASGTSYAIYEPSVGLVGSQSSTNITAVGNTWDYSLHIGSSGDGSILFTGDLAEIMVYDNQLAPTDITTVVNGLLTRWFPTNGG